MVSGNSRNDYIKIERSSHFFLTLGLGKLEIYSFIVFRSRLVCFDYLHPDLDLRIGGLPDEEMLLEWAKELGLVGIGNLTPSFGGIIAIALLGTVGVIRAMATTLGEEIGWRGFFIYELRKVLPFSAVSLFSGIVWASWHWPLIIYYGGNIALELTTFFVVIISMSFIMTYYTFKSSSLWPAVIFHAVSNVYVQKIFPPLTSKIEGSEN